MKKLITSAFLIFTILAANASGNNDTDINTQASETARRMANQIELNELEYIQIKKFTVEKLTRVATIKEMYTNDREMMTRKIMEVEASYFYKIQNMLNAKQLDKYIALQNSFKTNMVLIATDER